MNDLISRKAAADELRAYLIKDSIYDDDENVAGYNDGIKRGLDVILDLDAVDVSKWIPCSERLPESFNTVLVSLGGMVSVAWYDGGEWVCGTGFGTPLSIRPDAWMPLPEPYKGEKDATQTSD